MQVDCQKRSGGELVCSRLTFCQLLPAEFVNSHFLSSFSILPLPEYFKCEFLKVLFLVALILHKPGAGSLRDVSYPRSVRSISIRLD